MKVKFPKRKVLALQVEVRVPHPVPGYRTLQCALLKKYLGAAHSRVREDVGDYIGYADFPVGIIKVINNE